MTVQVKITKDKVLIVGVRFIDYEIAVGQKEFLMNSACWLGFTEDEQYATKLYEDIKTDVQKALKTHFGFEPVVDPLTGKTRLIKSDGFILNCASEPGRGLKDTNMVFTELPNTWRDQGYLSWDVRRLRRLNQ